MRDVVQILEEIARKAGAYMLQGNTEASEKSGVKDFVTVADIKSQAIIIRELEIAFPDEPILSEEHSELARKPMYEPTFTGFVVDPIDGTYNFKRGMQESAISIGHIKDGKPEYGVVYDPYKDEMFTAYVGGGAFCNGQPIHVSAQQDLVAASIATSNGYDDAAAVRNLQRQIALYDVTGIMPWTSCPGSAVLVLAWISCGRIDAIHHTGFKPWDNAVGLLLVCEAGGVVWKLGTMQAASFLDPAILAGSPKLADAMQVVFQGLEPILLT